MANPYDPNDDQQEQPQATAIGTAQPVASPLVQAVGPAPTPTGPRKSGTGFVGFDQYFSANKESAESAAKKQNEAIRKQFAGTQDKATQGLTDFKSNVASGVQGATISKADPNDPWSKYLATHGTYRGPTTYAPDQSGLQAAQDTYKLNQQAAQFGGFDALLAGAAGGADRAAVGRDLTGLQDFFKKQQDEAAKAVTAAQADQARINATYDTLAEEGNVQLAEDKRRADDSAAAAAETQAATDAKASEDALRVRLTRHVGGDNASTEDVAVMQNATPSELQALQSAYDAWDKSGDLRKFFVGLNDKSTRFRQLMDRLRAKYRGSAVVG